MRLLSPFSFWTLFIQVVIQVVKVRRRVAVEVEPPDAGEDLLVEDGAVGTEERPLPVGVALVPDLTPGLHIGVQPGGLAVAAERRLRGNVEDGVISLGLT